jgi:hypothetical protein
MFHNKTSEEACYIVKYSTKQDSLVIKVSPYQKEKILLGWGNFSDKFISEYIKDINSIEIASIKKKVQINSKQEIVTFFKKYRKGVFKNEIEIIIR